MPESLRDENRVEVNGRIGVASIHGRIGDVALSANLSECWHNVCRLDEGSAAISVGLKAERSNGCNKNGNVGTCVGAFVCESRGRERDSKPAAECPHTDRNSSLPGRLIA